jgi:cellulose synthase/poly-beta-1,6-N-acetylglucosamine synthase-like glycosyltransferase
MPHPAKDIFEACLYVVVFFSPAVPLTLISQHLNRWESRLASTAVFLGFWALAGTVAFVLTRHDVAVGTAFLGVCATLLAAAFGRDYRLSGYMFITSAVLLFVVGSGWALLFLLSINVSSLTRTCMLIGLSSLVVLAPLALIVLLPRQSYFFRRRFRRPHRPLEPTQRDHYPKVSLHVPTYAEPPDLVCSTLDALSRLTYPNFEVIVVDNNTKDESLWKPVREHCLRLGARFRFFHVSPLEGAKAGALNFALRHTADDAAIVGVIDADYHVEPDFIDRLVGYFDDPAVGFVQAPHDYRDWEENLFQRCCYWEYMPAYRLELACLNEWIASYIIGTMCLINRRALEEAGGWAEWCLTEDCECALRIHALGYSSVFVAETAGRGVVPERFLEYKMQRMRWTVGPVQQFKRHWRLFLPRWLSTPSKLTAWQRVLEISHSVEASTVVAVVLIPLGLVSLASLILHEECVVVPTVLWAATSVFLPSLLAMQWHKFRLAGCYSVRDMCGAMLASNSLVHIRLVSSLKAWLQSRRFAWRRTCKAKALPDRARALESAKSEWWVGVTFIALACLALPHALLVPPDLVCFASLFLLVMGVVYLAAPVMSFLGEHQLRQQTRRDQVGSADAPRAA